MLTHKVLCVYVVIQFFVRSVVGETNVGLIFGPMYV
jgi:hypothetical protein